MIAYALTWLNWRISLGQLKVRVRRSVTEPLAGRGPQAGNPLGVGVATGLLSCSDLFNNQRAGRYRDCVRTPATGVQSTNFSWVFSWQEKARLKSVL